MLINLAGNDSDADNALDLSSLVITSGPANGSVTVNANGTVSYQHNGSETTTDSFSYTIKDASGTVSAPVSVSIEVTPVNDAPVAVADSARVQEGQQVLIDLAEVLDRFTEGGFRVLRSEWQAHHSWQDRQVRLVDGNRLDREGICLGADEDGALLLRTSAGIERCLSGDLSLRVA